jgi:5-formyltetrahydrofolate cyclo-ligase
MSHPKSQLRQRVWDSLKELGVSLNPHGRIPTFDGQNMAAERLRRLKPYKDSSCIMVVPDEALLQVRINALRDGKLLLAATPGLREGFVLLDPQELRPSNWPLACRSSSLTRYGRQLDLSRFPRDSVEMMVTGAVAVDETGRRLGKGSGYFDLEYCILQHWGLVKPLTTIVCILHDAQLTDEVPSDPWDVPVDWIVTPRRVIPASDPPPRPCGIPWERLTHRDIRRIKPLWELRGLQGPSS